MRVTYVGHATLLVELGGARLLTDPNIDAHLAGVLPRVSRPVIPMAALSHVDAVLLSHAHADHLSYGTLKRLASDVPIYAPPHLARTLHRRGFTTARPLSPGGTASVGAVQITAARARHRGARYGVDQWHAGANMYLMTDGVEACLFAGDTAAGAAIDTSAGSLSHVLGELHARTRPLDVALLPIGAAPRWKRRVFRRGHLTAADALALFEHLGARYFIPYHWGTFRHVTSGPFDAMHELRRHLDGHARRGDVKILQPGSDIELPPRSPWLI
jgi:L-ascorbate metabolism protein UlaG (beta-lactamase superfamily)